MSQAKLRVFVWCLLPSLSSLHVKVEPRTSSNAHGTHAVFRSLGPWSPSPQLLLGQQSHPVPCSPSLCPSDSLGGHALPGFHVLIPFWALVPELSLQLRIAPGPRQPTLLVIYPGVHGDHRNQEGQHQGKCHCLPSRGELLPRLRLCVPPLIPTSDMVFEIHVRRIKQTQLQSHFLEKSSNLTQMTCLNHLYLMSLLDNVVRLIWTAS